MCVPEPEISSADEREEASGRKAEHAGDARQLEQKNRYPQPRERFFAPGSLREWRRQNDAAGPGMIPDR